MLSSLRTLAFIFGSIALAIYLVSAIDPPAYDHLFHSAMIGGVELPGDRRIYGAAGAALLIFAAWPWLRGLIRLAVIGFDQLRQLGERPKHGPRAWRG